MKRKLVIIGAGFTGLALAHYLLQKRKDLNLTIIEAKNKVGGLATGFKLPQWQWYLDYYYHHIFTSDKTFLGLLKELNLEKNLNFYHPQTSIWYNNKLIPFDTPFDLVNYPFLSFPEKLHLGLGLAFLKSLPKGDLLEGYSIDKNLPLLIGSRAYQQIFQPLVQKKFGQYQKKVNLAWFWSRIKNRSKALGYYQGGFQRLANQLRSFLEKQGVMFFFNQSVSGIHRQGKKFNIQTKKNNYQADILVITSPPQNWWPDSLLAEEYQLHWQDKKYLGSQVLILRLKNKFLAKTYWLNINQKGYPFLILCQHTNMVKADYYNGEEILYIGNYLSQDKEEWQENSHQLFKRFYPYLKKIKPSFSSKDVIGYHKFQSAISQPIMELNYSQQLPAIKTKIKHLYIANIFQIYPHDRGLNYSLELAKKTSQEIIANSL